MSEQTFGHLQIDENESGGKTREGDCLRLSGVECLLTGTPKPIIITHGALWSGRSLCSHTRSLEWNDFSTKQCFDACKCE